MKLAQNRRGWRGGALLLAGGLAAVAVVFSAVGLARTPKTVLVGRARTAAQYELGLGRGVKGKPLKLARSGSRDMPLVRTSIYHPHGYVDPRGAIAEARTRQGRKQMLTFWEERNPGKASRQQRWYQYMSNQDAGPMVGALGAGWDGVDRSHMFPGEGAVLDPHDPRYGALSPVPRFPEAEADQKWIYRHAPEEIERPYRVDEGERERLIGELGGTTHTYAFEAPENGVLKGLAVGDSDGYKTDQVISAKAAWVAGEKPAYGRFAHNGGLTYGDKAIQWEDPIGEVPEFPRSKTVQSVVEGAADSLWR